MVSIQKSHIEDVNRAYSSSLERDSSENATAIACTSRLLGSEVGLNHRLIPTREQGHDLFPLSLDRGCLLLGCQHEQDRVFTVEDLEEGLWFCSLTCSNQSVGGAIPSAQRSLVVALIDCDGAMRIGNVDLGEGLGQAMRRSRQRRKEDGGQRIA